MKRQQKKVKHAHPTPNIAALKFIIVFGLELRYTHELAITTQLLPWF